MNEDDEQHYSLGHRRAYLSMLNECLRQLDYDDPVRENAALIAEREQAIQMLRQVCERFGDNDWDPDLNLEDIIAKHLWNHLENDR